MPQPATSEGAISSLLPEKNCKKINSFFEGIHHKLFKTIEKILSFQGPYVPSKEKLEKAHVKKSLQLPPSIVPWLKSLFSKKLHSSHY